MTTFSVFFFFFFSFSFFFFFFFFVALRPQKPSGFLETGMRMYSGGVYVHCIIYSHARWELPYSIPVFVVVFV